MCITIRSKRPQLSVRAKHFMAHSWTIGDELCRLSDSQHKSEALRALHLVDRARGDYHIEEIEPWQRGGAETYTYVFEVLQAGARQRFILKALVAPTPDTPPARQLEKWVTRRDRLAGFGVLTPRLYVARDGVLLEEFIARDATGHLKRKARNGTLDSSVETELEDVCARVYEAGFRPLGILSNLRVRRGRFVWIDFGTDLGDVFSAARLRVSPRQIVLRELETRVYSSIRPSRHS